MKARLARAWGSRSPHERVIIALLAALLGVLLYVWLLHSAGQARAGLSTNITALRAQAQRLEHQALEYGSLRAAPAVTSSSTDLRTIVETGVHTAGLESSLVRLDAVDADQAVAVFGAIAFEEWLKWIADLRSQHIRLDACRIEALSTPGLVSVTATLVRTKAQ